jgi:hypothetical protein
MHRAQPRFRLSRLVACGRLRWPLRRQSCSLLLNQSNASEGCSHRVSDTASIGPVLYCCSSANCNSQPPCDAEPEPPCWLSRSLALLLVAVVFAIGRTHFRRWYEVATGSASSYAEAVKPIDFTRHSYFQRQGSQRRGTGKPKDGRRAADENFKGSGADWEVRC